MLKHKLLSIATTIGLGLLPSQAVWAQEGLPGELPGPAIVGLVAAGIIGAIVVSRSRK